ncbi:uncharacterized protein LOC108716104 isoform X1 [Xenopus laevis]|uniref:Ig-like domain-containing protein n=2 Tax=Xenopus laevis TaxID=8355 RepID=A0A974HIV4_XENLA|nr:uncharacterized protein LOC108716104 isoform X1 [Xenopus laevis]OCT79639.1 hypothetical protein XELAEV_18026447mg [Xenopus laevis]
MTNLSQTLLLIATLSHTSYGASIIPTAKPSIWSVRSKGQTQLLCLVPETYGDEISIWFSNGNGTELGTYYSPGIADHLSIIAITKLHKNVPSSNNAVSFSSGTHIVASRSKRNVSSVTDWSKSSFIDPPAHEEHQSPLPLPPQYENLGAYAILSLPTEELKDWGSITCLVADAGTRNVWHQKSFEIQGEVEGKSCHEERHSEELGNQHRFTCVSVLTLRLIVWKLLTFDLLMTSVAILEEGGLERQRSYS